MSPEKLQEFLRNYFVDSEDSWTDGHNEFLAFDGRIDLEHLAKAILEFMGEK
jgi:hypothetical protein